MSAPEMTGGPNDLTREEWEEFGHIDARIVRIRDQGSLPLGRLLRAVRDGELWRAGWPDREARKPSFGAYVRERADRTPRRARDLIHYADLRDEWEPGSPFPPTERQGRPFVGLTVDQRREVARRVGDFSGVAADRIKRVAEEVKAGREVVAGEPGPLVTVRGGAVTLDQSGFARLLDDLHETLGQVARLGPHAIPDAVRAMDDEEAARRLRELEQDAHVLHALLTAFHGRFPDGPPDGQRALDVMLR